MQRPIGVTILAILAALGGILALCGSLALIGLGGVLGGILGSQVSAGAGFLVGMLGVIFGVITLVIALLELALAYGAWNLRPWAWLLGIATESVAGLFSLIRLLDGRGSTGVEVINIAIAALIVYYLLTPEVRKAFGRT